MKNDRLSIVVSSPDSYKDAFAVLLKSFFAFWPDCQYEFILGTNTQEYSGIKVVLSNESNDTWKDRMKIILDVVKSKYVLMLTDDNIITKPIKNEEVEMILDDMDKYDLNFCKLNKSPNARGKELYKNAVLRRIPLKQPYGKNLQVAIFRTSYLKEIISSKLSAYELENRWIVDSSTAKKGYFQDCVVHKKNFLGTVHGIVAGKWMPTAVWKIKKAGITINSQRKVMPVYQELKLKIIHRVSLLFSSKTRMKIKKILAKSGKKFVTEA